RAASEDPGRRRIPDPQADQEMDLLQARRGGNRPIYEDARGDLNLQLAADIAHAVGRQLEKLHRAFRALEHPREQFFAPLSHPRRIGRPDQLLPPEEEARAHHVERLAAATREGKVSRDVDLVHEAVVQDHPVEARARVVELEPPLGRTCGTSSTLTFRMMTRSWST